MLLCWFATIHTCVNTPAAVLPDIQGIRDKGFGQLVAAKDAIYNTKTTKSVLLLHVQSQVCCCYFSTILMLTIRN